MYLESKEGVHDGTDSLEIGRYSVRNAAPRRRKTASRRTNVWQPDFEIRDDAYSQSVPQRVLLNGDQNSTVYSTPERLHRATTTAPRRLAQSQSAPSEAQKSAEIRQMVPLLLTERELANNSEKMASVSSHQEGQRLRSPKMLKDPRRRTIYIPSDDTTIMTIHPGASLRPDKVPLTKHDAIETLQHSVHEKEKKRTPEPTRYRAARKSLAVAPRRAPLQQSSRPVQGATISSDVIGSGGGKENIPPGTVFGQEGCKGRKSGLLVSNKWSRTAVQQADPSLAWDDMTNKTAVSHARLAESKKRTINSSMDGSCRSKVHKGRYGPIALPDKCNRAVSSISGNTSARPRPVLSKASAQSPFQSVKHAKPPSKLSMPLVNQVAKQQRDQYPIIADDIMKPELYENDWLNHQEAAITQLVNSLFDAVGRDDCEHVTSAQDLGHSVQAVYHEPSIPLLFKRLQASLLYGALSIPKDLLCEALRIRDDLGIRRKFLNLWLETYNLSLLKAAVEVVVGRQATQTITSSNVSSSGIDRGNGRMDRKAVEIFLETFLIRNEDAVRVGQTLGSIGSIARGGPRTADDCGSQGWSWRRTVLRSLMLILVLDRIKTLSLVAHCLFRPKSPYKSSTSVLHALSSLILPSSGDISRALSHLNYHVSHIQYPLQEYTYRITNLATDLRDGVRLSRLVEILLYPPSVLTHEKEDVTITMPTGEILSTPVGHKDSWVLSHHLKFPCMGRVQKVYNSQIALSALQGVKGIGSMLDGAKAEDIVDGHREKTVGLLWGLVSKWGLETLIDLRDLQNEIYRLRKKGEGVLEDEWITDEETELEYMTGSEKCTFLLKSWARSIASLHRLKVVNLSTSFADGKVLEKIVDEYEPYIPSSGPQCSLEMEGLKCNRLEAKLKNIGCGKYFASLFGHTAHAGRIFDRDFTIATLTFLCSRLLSASKKGRAASVIQKAWRHLLLCRKMHQRCVAIRLAHECQKVVLTRDKVIAAASVIQTAWRICLDRRIGRLVRVVTTLQASSRGWLVRRDLGVVRGRSVNQV